MFRLESLLSTSNVLRHWIDFHHQNLCQNVRYYIRINSYWCHEAQFRLVWSEIVSKVLGGQIFKSKFWCRSIDWIERRYWWHCNRCETGFKIQVVWCLDVIGATRSTAGEFGLEPLLDWVVSQLLWWSIGGKTSMDRLVRMRWGEWLWSGCPSMPDCRNEFGSNPVGRWAHVYHAAGGLPVMVDWKFFPFFWVNSTFRQCLKNS